jgi:hypothetical protein
VKLRARGLRPAPSTPDFLIYRDRLLRYFPRRSARSVDVIWADDDPPLISGDPTMGWGYVARVNRHSMNGDHTTMLTDHVGELGAVMRRIFDAADQKA